MDNKKREEIIKMIIEIDSQKKIFAKQEKDSIISKIIIIIINKNELNCFY